jgi:hypothetical protein
LAASAGELLKPSRRAARAAKKTRKRISLIIPVLRMRAYRGIVAGEQGR